MRCLCALGLAFSLLLVHAADVLAAGQRGLFTKRSTTAAGGTALATKQQPPTVAYPLQSSGSTAVQSKTMNTAKVLSAAKVATTPSIGASKNSGMVASSTLMLPKTIKLNAASDNAKEDFTSKSESTKTVQLSTLSAVKLPAPLTTKGPAPISATPIPLPGPSVSTNLAAKGPNLISATPIPIPGPSGGSTLAVKGTNLVSATPIQLPKPRPLLKNVLVAKTPNLISATPIPLPDPMLSKKLDGKESTSTSTGRQTQSNGSDTDIGDTYNFPEEQEKAGLNKMLGTMEQALLDFLAQKLPGGAFGAAVEKTFKDAFAEAAKGNVKPLQDLVDAINKDVADPQAKQDLIAAIEAYMKAQALLQDVGQGPLDDKKLQELKDMLAKFPVPSAKDSLLAALGDIQKWNDWMKDMAKNQPAPPDGGLPGDPGLPIAPGLPITPGLPVDPGYPVYPVDPGYVADPGVVAVGGGSAGVAVAAPAASVVVEAAPAPPTAIPTPGGRVLLQNPQANAAGVNYVLNDQHAFEMKAGQQQELAARAAGPWTIAFDRGGNFGTAQYALTGGTYLFTLTDKGWDLASAPNQ